MRIIVNADDFGISAQCNEATHEMLSHNRITSATIMANAPYVTDALRHARHFTNFSFGVHLNLTEFRPLTPVTRLQPLLAEDGTFSGNIWKVKFSTRLLAAVADELCSQIDFIRSQGVGISHIDSHQHIHTIPSLFPVIKFLQKKYGIRRIRISRNFNLSTGRYRGLLLLKKRIYNFALRHIVSSRTTDGFSDLLTFIEQGKKGAMPCRTFEIMVHPGTNEAEDKLLRSPWEKDLPFALEYINYNDL